FSNPEGFPGDGEDEFSLIEDYESGDDHSTDNVPILIEKLARVMNTSSKGFTSIGDMENAINQWLVDVNLSDSFEKNTTDKPTFNFLEGEITRSQNVILLLGYYDYIISEKLVDQSQPIGLFTKLLQSSTWWDYQSFKPSVERLDAIRIRLRSTSSDTSEIEINVYDSQQGEPIGSAILDPGYLITPTWIQFHFDPYIELTPDNTYYFDVRQKEHGYHYEWDYESYNPYSRGTGWMDKNPYDPYGFQFDWTFETEFYDPPPGSVRREGHYVTCAGVNSKNSSIAFSDPRYNISNQDGNNHNDAKNVSHDRYNVNSSCPIPDMDYNCWLPDYPTKYTYTIVEQAIVICPIPDEEPPTVEITKPRKAIYFLNEEIYPFFFPIIVGPIDIEVTAVDNKEVEYIEFIINNKKQKTDYTEPYKWRWEEGVFFVQIIDIVAVDSSGNYGYTTLTVLKFF
ncbi:MAG: Ig-like domain-containing protein, partial [Candidatus Hodarchaeota archaeon]